MCHSDALNLKYVLIDLQLQIDTRIHEKQEFIISNIVNIIHRLFQDSKDIGETVFKVREEPNVLAEVQ